MKKLLLMITPATIFISCFHSTDIKDSKQVDAKSAAIEICDCYNKANHITEEPARTNAQNDCIKKETGAKKKLKENSTYGNDFKKALDSCTNELLNKNLK